MVRIMNWIDQLTLFSTFDIVAVCLLVTLWITVGWAIEHSPRKYPSMSSLIAGFRREWMVQMVTREPRVFDAQIVSSLRQGTAFFASTSMIAIGGGLALIGSADQLAVVANDLTLDTNPIIVWEVKLLVMLLFVTNAFLKFVWANRLFGYCSVLLAAVPNDQNHPDVYARAAQAGEIGVAAARGFNRGLRSIYFSLASAAWLLGAGPLVFATLATVLVLGRREFASRSRSILLSNPAPTQT